MKNNYFLNQGFRSVFYWVIIVLAIFCLGTKSIIAQNYTPTIEEETKSGKNIRIGVVYINTPTGNKHWEGINEAVRGSEFFEYIELRPYHYTTANDGFELLKELILSAETDIILGPTESEIFVRAVSLEETFAAKKVTVISGLATARVGNRKDGWFFRTNVDVTRRAQTIYDFLNKYWIATMAVLYEDTEFGRRAQRAFESELSSNNQEDRCTFLLYDTPPHPRKQLQAIIKNRPEAVGFFCEREEIAQIYSELKKMNKSATPYNPMLFTILDVGVIANQVDDIFFVSLLSDYGAPENKMPMKKPVRGPEARALGYDLGIFACRVIKAVNNGNNRITQKFDEAGRMEFREQFRKQLSTLMSLSYKLDKSRTKMAFTKFENTALPGVFHLDGENIKPVPISKSVNWWHKLVHKLKLIFAVYGWYWICLSLLIILFFAFFINRMEIKRMFPCKHVKIYRTWAFHVYTAIHFIVVLLIYVFLCESGRIKYDDILMVIIISLTPSAFLRTTFFETRYGKAVGLEGIYKSIMATIEENIMRTRYKSLEALTNIIAYSNSLDSIKKSLLQVYKCHPSLVQRAKLIQKMEEDIENEKEYLNKRRKGARLLLRQFDKAQLKAEGFVPWNWDYDNQIDPRLIVRKAAKYCADDPKKVEKITGLLNEQMDELKERNKERYTEMKDFMDKELAETITLEGELTVRIRQLFVLRRFDLDWLIKEELIQNGVREEKDFKDGEKKNGK